MAEPAEASAIRQSTLQDAGVEHTPTEWNGFLSRLDQDLGNTPIQDDQRLREEIKGLRDIMHAYQDRSVAQLPVSRKYEGRSTELGAGDSQGSRIFWLGVDFKDEIQMLPMQSLSTDVFGHMVCATFEETIFQDGMMDPRIAGIMLQIRAFTGEDQ